LAPGGLLAYVTCSPHPAETREVVAAALARHPELTALDTPAVLAGIATRELDLAPATHAQLWPHRHGTDAMFIQLMTKVEA
jgi:16S rRNA (cytosine967-C5)-methyltransferase